MEILQGMVSQWGPFALAALAFWKLDRRMIRLEVVLERLARIEELSYEKAQSE